MTTTRKVDRRERDIKKKLSAAIIMLLLSCIMVVTSTFAWFTLSTAPEVTGISTTIGGNGNLEIALAGYNAEGQLITPAHSTTGDGTKTLLEKNITWGNLVNVDDTAYGLNKIVLKPSALNAPGGVVNSASMLSIPEYGTDGRVTQLLSTVSSGIYDTATGNFKAGYGYGVRGLGVSASKTERQFAYSGALSNISSNKNSAESIIETALAANGKTLTDLAIAYGLGSESFTLADIQNVKKLVTETQAALPYIEQSLVSFIDGILASDYGKRATDAAEPGLGIDDTEYLLISDTVKSIDIDSDQVTVSDSGNTVTITITVDKEYTYSYENATLANAIRAYKSISSNLTAASTAADKLITDNKSSYSDTELKTLLDYVMAFSTADGDEKVTIETYTLAEIKAAPTEYAGLLAKEMGTGLDINLNNGSGVYYNTASLIGPLSSRFLADINVSYLGAAVNVPGAVIVINSKPENTPYFNTLTTVVEGLDEPTSDGAAETSQIDDLYAFALDLYFRTNAANSNLVLQTEEAQRIYEDGNNSDTMGNGSKMTFTYHESLTPKMIEGLLESINIVFINGDSGDDANKILATAKLDVKNAVYEGANSVTANMYLVDADGTTLKPDKSVIRELTQNTAHLVTALVYLDGETITNADVATAAQSMTGTMNLQFASDAKLEAMDYTALKQGDTKVEEPAMSVSGNNLSLTGLDSTKTYTLTYKSTTTVTTDTALTVPTITDGKATVDVSTALSAVPTAEDVTFTLKEGTETVATATAKGTKTN